MGKQSLLDLVCFILFVSFYFFSNFNGWRGGHRMEGGIAAGRRSQNLARAVKLVCRTHSVDRFVLMLAADDKGELSY